MSVRVESLESRRLFADTLSAGINVAQTFQTIDAIGGAANSGYQLPEYRQAGYFNKVFGDLGITAVRSALDPGWELTNDNADPNVINFAGFNDGAIANTMEFFKQAKARGVKTFLLSFWTPSAWMKTGKAGKQGGQLRPDLRDEYAEYITAALLRAHDKWGVDITHVSIANEPWFTEPYPSTMWTPQQLTLTIKTVAQHLKAAGLTNVQITGPEDVSSIYRVTKYTTTIAADPEANAEYPIIATHYLNDQDAQNLAQTASSLGKKIWYSEAGNGSPDITGALGIARGVDSAFVRAGATAWFNWQISGTTAFEAMMSGQTPNPKYYALKQFAHFIKPGYQRVGVNYTGDSVRVSAYKDPATGNLTVVMSSNKTTDTTVDLSLAGGTVPASFEQFRTSATENCVQLANVAGGSKMSITLPANSIVTLYSGPDAAPLTNTTAAPLVPVPQYDDAWNTNDLRRAAMLGQVDTVKSLVDGGANVNAAFGNGWTPLFTAAASPYNKADMALTYLIQHGADVQHRDVEGLTALHVAAMSEIPAYGTIPEISARRINSLLAAGVPVNAQDGYGRTALMYAAMLPKLGGDFGRADTSVLQALLAAGASTSIKDNLGRTALDWAKAERAPQAVGVLSAPGTLRASVFKDANQNGTQESGEAGIANVSVYLDLNGNAKLDPEEVAVVTNASGIADFGSQFIDTYTLRAATPDATYTPAEAFATVTVNSNATTTALLAFVPPGSPPPPVQPPAGTSTISGYVVNDKNNDGKWSSGEAGIAGRTVYLDTNKNGTLDAGDFTQTTASNGKYIFANIAAGTYTIREVLPSGSTQTHPAGNAAFTVTVASGVTRTGQDFTVTGTVTPPPPPPPATGTASIHAYVISDVNRDGKWSSGEKGVAGRTVWIDTDGDGLLDTGEATAVTAANGSFDFTTLAAGTYLIRQVLPSGWVQTYPAAGAALKITVTDGQLKSGSSLGTATA